MEVIECNDENDGRSSNESKSMYASWVMVLLVVCAAVGSIIVVAIVAGWFSPRVIAHAVLVKVMPAKPDWTYACALSAVIIVLEILPVPILVLVLPVPGMVFGLYTGFLIVLPSVFVGVTAAFVFGRWLLQERILGCIASEDHPSIRAVMQAFNDGDRDALLILVLYRFLVGPVFIKNYSSAVLPIPMWKLVASAMPQHIWRRKI
eukprot:TRINITY_DN28321_c0_g1_i1.p1 TRINITY_DN28321_c0_g1~~TRINITY_DN28321_c0_g1_i1.p1  ORF type:complete len:233 (-),score=16.77 TRINITY_DN28321_c0_g1_i1:383-997(-)